VRSSSTPANTAYENKPARRDPLAATCAYLIRERLPNFLRLYPNPFVAKCCFCLSRYVHTTWFADKSNESPYPCFLANSPDEALSGAIKLARFSCNAKDRSQVGLVVDGGNQLGPFASVSLASGARIGFIPQLGMITNLSDLEAARRSGERFGFVVVVGSCGLEPAWIKALSSLLREQDALFVACVNRAVLRACRHDTSSPLRAMEPDIVVFDDSFVNHDVPFGAFAAKKPLLGQWQTPARSNFHSTTFQPNTISTLHFVRCLEAADPAFHAGVSADLHRLETNTEFRLSVLTELYSPALCKTIRSIGFAGAQFKASGHYFEVDGRKIFDGVAGVACSMRGHNPDTYVQELEDHPDEVGVAERLRARLEQLTGLAHMAPAVSGGNAVENALRLGLAASYPNKYVLAFRGGFGGKTLLALTGTAKSSYKTNLAPLYEHVIFVDPNAETALDDLEASLLKYPVGVVQFELIQAVGGVRGLPDRIISFLQEHKRRFGYLLFVDEVQTGMYRTGSFTLSEAMGLKPDIMTLGKGASDMMVPFAVTLYSAEIFERLQAAAPELVRSLSLRCAYEHGMKTMLNVIDQAQHKGLPERVGDAAALFAKLLSEQLRDCRAVEAVRVHGLLIAVELATGGWLRRRFKKLISSFVILRLLHHRRFPLFIGYCQYESHVLKLTPPLSITPEEVEQICASLGAVLRLPLYRLFAAGLAAVARAKLGNITQARSSRNESIQG
jgi:acetylornithine/succinyldiaminopimelate/putrescine aminotransferase